MRSTNAITAVVFLIAFFTNSGLSVEVVQYASAEVSLQRMIDKVAPGTIVVCDPKEQLEIRTPLMITKAMTLDGLNARLPKALGKTSIVVVDAKGVTLTNLTLHGNYDSVNQKDRAPLILIRKGKFRIEGCKFYDGSKDGVQVTPQRDSGDIAGGVIKNIEALRMGRDAVSISGGNKGQLVRDVTIENVSLKKGYRRGAVEVSDGTDNIIVRGVYAENCLYAIDVQDHGKQSAPNTNITISDVTAIDCKHVVRTSNSLRGHANLRLSKLTAKSCELPVQISNTRYVAINGLRILNHRTKKSPPIALMNSQEIDLRDITIETAHFTGQPVQSVKCTDVRIKGLKVIKN